MPNLCGTLLKDVQVLGGTSEPGRVAENYHETLERSRQLFHQLNQSLLANFRNKVENMPVAPYTTYTGDFQGVLGSTEAEKYDGYRW